MAKLNTDIYVGIDGTGPEKLTTDIGVSKIGKKQRVNPGYGKSMQYVDLGDEDSYAHEFTSGHVYNYWKNWHGAKRYYKRGPELWGFSTEDRAKDAYDWVTEARKYSGGRIFLCGYSRGAYAVVRVAQMLKQLSDSVEDDFKFNVHALMLFDAVQRTPENAHNMKAYFKGHGNVVDVDQGSSLIPDNVERCHHLRRNPQACTREFMGNCSTGVQSRQNTSYYEEFIWGTHGALGGVFYRPATGQPPSEMIEEPGTGITNVSFVQDEDAARTGKEKMDRFLESAL